MTIIIVGGVTAGLIGVLAGPMTAAAQTAAEVAKANNPLAPVTAVNLHDYFVPTLSGVPDQSSNVLMVRGVFATSRMILRATLPLSTVPSGSADPASGLGDLNVFDAFLLTSSESKTQFEIGPLLVAPTATDEALGAGKVMRAGGAVLNLFLEPQFTVLHRGIGQPAFQVFTGIMAQFPAS